MSYDDKSAGKGRKMQIWKPKVKPFWVSELQRKAAVALDATLVTAHPDELEKDSWMFWIEFENGDVIAPYATGSCFIGATPFQFDLRSGAWIADVRIARQQMVMKQGGGNA